MTAKQPVRCQHCNQKIRVVDSRLGTFIRCPSCHEQTLAAGFDNDTSAAVKTPFADNRDAKNSLEKLLLRDHQNSEPPGSVCPKKIGRFEILRKVGEGGFGIVYEANDPQLGRTIALKAPSFGRDDQRRIRRFVTEARSAARLHHPNIVAVYENGETPEGQLYIASEFVKGLTLKDILISETPPPLQERIEWIRDIAGALAYAHVEGIIHRDIKPENILIDERTRRPKLADFGLAKVVDDDLDEHQKTRDGILGTPAFMSPEQARAEMEKVGPLSDQYGLGAVMYQCLTGAPPYRGSIFIVVAAVAGDEEPVPILSLNAGIPMDLVAICNKSMSKQATERYTDCREMLFDLNSWLADEPVSARPPSYVRRVLSFVRKNPLPTALSVLSSLLLGLFAMTMAIAYQRAHLDRQEIDRQRLNAQDESRKANLLVEQLTKARSDAEGARLIAVNETRRAEEETKRAEKALNDLKEQIQVAANAEEGRQMATNEAEEASLAASNAKARADLSEYRSKVKNLASLLHRFLPKTARAQMPLVEASSCQLELRYLRSCTNPVVEKLDCPFIPDSTQACVDELGQTFVIRDRTGVLHVGRRTNADVDSPLKWLKISGLPVETMSLSPSGETLLFCKIESTSVPTGVANSYRVIQSLKVAELTIKGMVADTVEPQISWQPLMTTTELPSGLSVGLVNGRVVFKERLSSRTNDHSSHCSQKDWSDLTHLHIRNSGREVDYRANILDIRSQNMPTRKNERVTFASRLARSDSVLIGYQNGDFDVLSKNGKLLQSFKASPEKIEPVTGVALHPSDDIVAVLSDSMIRIIDPNGGIELANLQTPLDGKILSVAFTPSGYHIIAHLVKLDVTVPAESDRTTLLLLDPTVSMGRSLVADWKDRLVYKSVAQASLSNDERMAAIVTTDDQGVEIVSVASGERLANLRIGQNDLVAGYFFDEKHLLLITSGSIQKWNWENQTLVHEYDLTKQLNRRQKMEILSAYWLPQKESIAIVCIERRTGRSNAGLRETEEDHIVFVVSINEPTSSSSEQEIKLGWTRQSTGQRARSLFAASRIGDRWLMRPETSNSVELRDRLWWTDVEIKVLQGSDATLLAADISPDGTRVVTGHQDGTVKFWDVASGEELLSADLSDKPIKSIHVGNSNKVAIIAVADGTVRLLGDVYEGNSIENQ